MKVTDSVQVPVVQINQIENHVDYVHKCSHVVEIFAEVAPFEGNRISLVYYNILKPTDVSKEEFCKEVDSFEFVIAIKNNIDPKNT